MMLSAPFFALSALGGLTLTQKQVIGNGSRAMIG